MGGKKGGPDVYDFLYSLDWGLCHGPLDRVNMVWVKDKPIWCGDASDRVNAIVDQPDLFGGDDAEGGVVGTVEVYPGKDDQNASEALAARVGRTPATMPGYRGIAHLFFRGHAPGERPSIFNLGGLIPAAETDTRAPGSAYASGFRWGTNNPYLPKLKASVTRLPVGLGTQYREIYPVASIANDGTWEPAQLYVVENSGETHVAAEGGPPGSGSPTIYSNIIVTDWVTYPGDPDLVIDLLTLYPSQAEIDLAFANGTIDFTARIDGYANKEPIAGGPGPGQLQTQIGVALFRDDGNGNPDYTAGPVQDWAVTDVQVGAISNSLTPPQGGVGIGQHTGVRFVKMRAVHFAPSWITMYWDATLTGTLKQSITLTYEKLAVAHCQVDGEIGALPDANPAHIIYDCLTNPDWGKGEDPAMIDTASFQAAAATLHSEFFGLSMTWVRQATIEDFIQEVLDHIRATLFVDPATGLWSLKLFRADYVAASAPLLDPSNCTLTDRKRRAWGETINEIVVSYTDAKTEEEATVTAHDLGNIQVQGGVVSETRDYYGIRNRILAQYVADRDVAEASQPLFSCTANVSRSFWNLRPGDVVRVTWPEDGLTEMVCRITAIDYGRPTDRQIVLSLVEDIFSVERTEYGEPQGPLWTSDTAVAAALDHEIAITAPLPSMLRSGGVLADIDAAYPSVAVLLMGDATPRPVEVQAHTSVALGNGTNAIQGVKTFPVSRSVATDALLAPEVTSQVNGPLLSELFVGAPEIGDLAMLGSGEAGSEIVMLDSYDEVNDIWTVIRGVWDTVPGTWAIGTRLWAFPDSGLRADPTERAGGEAITYRFLPRGENGLLDYNDAANVTITTTERPHMPFRPANAQLDGNGFGITVYNDASTYPTSITASWENRNRTNEDAVALKWDAGNVTPETGQTTVLRFLDDQGALSHEITGLTGTSRAITIAEFQGLQVGFIEFLAERDGIRSWTGAQRAFDIRVGGYGQNYGNYYGP